MGRTGKMVVAFTATWCGHCKELKPIWKKMEEKLKEDKNVN